MEKLRYEKYELSSKKNRLYQEYEDLQEQVENFDPEFVQKLREEFNNEHSDTQNYENTNITNNEPAIQKNTTLDVVKPQLKNYKSTEENIKKMEELERRKYISEDGEYHEEYRQD